MGEETEQVPAFAGMTCGRKDGAGPCFRRDDGWAKRRSWLAAFAGMTSVSAFSLCMCSRPSILSFPRKREPIFCSQVWIPAFAGMTGGQGNRVDHLHGCPLTRPSPSFPSMSAKTVIPAHAGIHLYPTISGYKSSQQGFLSSINCILQARFQAFMRFSLMIASLILS